MQCQCFNVQQRRNLDRIVPPHQEMSLENWAEGQKSQVRFLALHGPEDPLELPSMTRPPPSCQLPSTTTLTSSTVEKRGLSNGHFGTHLNLASLL